MMKGDAVGFYETARQLAVELGPKAADLVTDLIRTQAQEWRAEMVSVANDKVTERATELHRRFHEDIAGVELRLTAQIADSERRLNSEMGAVRKEAAANKQELADRVTASERQIARWLLTVFVVQGVFLVALSWMTKHVF